MAIDNWKNKEVVVHISSGIFLSYKKKHIWIRSNEVDEPRAYPTELSQKEKDQYCIIMCIYGIWKDGTNDPTYGAAKEAQT